MTATATPLDTVAEQINENIAEGVRLVRAGLAHFVQAGVQLGEAKSVMASPSLWQQWVQASIHTNEKTRESSAWSLLSLAGQSQESRIQRLASAVGVHQDDMLQDSDRRRP